MLNVRCIEDFLRIFLERASDRAVNNMCVATQEKHKNARTTKERYRQSGSESANESESGSESESEKKLV